MAYTTIDDPSEYFHTQLYAGDGNDDRSITNDANAGNFKPDWLWIKNRSGTNSHALVDSTRGSTKVLRSNATNAEETEANGIQAFETDGFQIGSSGLVNTSGNNYVAWQWKANGGTTTTNNDGSTASTVQAITEAGFSIVTFSRSAGGTITVGHGLGKKPEWIIVKSRQTSNNWVVTHKSLGTEMQDFYLILNGTDASSNSNDIFGGEPTTSVFSTTNNVASNDNQVAYCFTSIKGYSKFGSYTGNGNADGAFVYTGFKPAWLMIKRTDSANHFLLFDIKRDISNFGEKWLRADTTDAESNGIYWDGLSNGFKARTNDPIINASGGTYIYMAFAEHPFVSSKGVPVTAR